jgi:DNA-binding PadR family transcriptional regulator
MVVFPDSHVMAESTRYAVLGLVARSPTHGYALYAEIERWPVPEELRPGRSTVYRHLERLLAGGLIEPVATAEAGVDSRKPDRAVFAATPDGIRRLEDYIGTPPRSFDELCVRISACRPDDLPQLIAFAQDLEQRSMQVFQEHSASPDALTLAQRGAPWRMVTRALVARAQAADVAVSATILGDLRSDLEALQQGT